MIRTNNLKNSFFKPDLSNPLLIYTIIWLIILFLYSLELTINIAGLNRSTVFLIFGTIFIFTAVYYCMYFAKISFKGLRMNIHKPFAQTNPPQTVVYFSKIIRFISLVWLAGTIMEIFLFRGIPLISVVVLHNYDLNYSAFGIPTFHGLMNACYFTITVSNYLLYLQTKQKKYLYRMLILLTWPLLVMARAVLLWVLIEVLCVYFLLHRINLKRIVGLFFAVILLIIVFGSIGDNRGEVKETKFTDNFIREEHKTIVAPLPSGFIWVYLYATTPLNNIVINIDHIEPTYNFQNTLITLVPSVIRDNMTTSASNNNNAYSFTLYEEAFNVSSYFKGFLNDFGITGTLILAGVVQIFCVLFFFSAKSSKIGGVIAYASMFNALMMSCFYDFFFSLVTVIQVFIGLLINYLLYTKSRKIHVQG